MSPNHWQYNTLSFEPRNVLDTVLHKHEHVKNLLLSLKTVLNVLHSLISGQLKYAYFLLHLDALLESTKDSVGMID